MTPLPLPKACARRVRSASLTPRAGLHELRRRIKNIVGVVEVQGVEASPEGLLRLRLHRLQCAKPGLHAYSLRAAFVANVSRLLLVRSQLAALFEVHSLRIHHHPNNLEHSGYQHTLLKVDQALFIVDAVDQERASNERHQFRACAAPGKARHVRLLHSIDGEATEVVQPEGESHSVRKGFGYTLDSALSVVADRRDHFDRTVGVTRVARGWPVAFV